SFAMEALNLVNLSKGITESSSHIEQMQPHFKQESIFEFAVSPGLANKKFTAKQMALLAEVVGDKGDIEYTPHHQLIVRVSVSEPDKITRRLTNEGFLLSPI